MLTKSKILSRLKKVTEHTHFSSGIEEQDNIKKYWEGYRDALKDVLETEMEFPISWE